MNNSRDMLKKYEKSLQTATLRGMQKWPSYRGGRLMETHDDRVLKYFE